VRVRLRLKKQTTMRRDDPRDNNLNEPVREQPIREQPIREQPTRPKLSYIPGQQTDKTPPLEQTQTLKIYIEYIKAEEVALT
jgi:hypothetical protein